MSQPTTAINLNGTTPNAAPGFQNGKFASDNATPMQSVTVAVPSAGNVNHQTGNYTVQASDCGKLVVINSANAAVVTLPQSVPFAQWTCDISSIGAGTTTVTPGALQLDGSTANIALTQDQSCHIATDGTDYFSGRGIGGGPGTNTGIDGGVPSSTYGGTTPIDGGTP
jgi:hypothetical protein